MREYLPDGSSHILIFKNNTSLNKEMILQQLYFYEPY
jgi:hypothetical protein